MKQPAITIQLSLMVEPAVGKYLHHNHPSNYVVNVKHPLGSWIVHALAPKNTLQRLDLDTKWFRERCKDLTYEFKFELPDWYLKRVGCYIPAQKMAQFNTFVLNMMYSELMLNIVYRHGFRDEQIQVCIEEFREKYDILEKELPDERLRKKYLRLRNKYEGNFIEAFKPGDLLWRL